MTDHSNIIEPTFSKFCSLSIIFFYVCSVFASLLLCVHCPLEMPAEEVEIEMRDLVQQRDAIMSSHKSEHVGRAKHIASRDEWLI